jgi:GTP cyclohydrolase II
MYRDVPTAALWTYLSLIEKSIKTHTNLPDSLIHNINLGRDTVKSDPKNAEKYIDNMLAYFKFHGLETDASYACAAIQAGMIIELIGEQRFDVARNYVQHLTIKPHKQALKSAIAGEKIEL